MRKLLPTALLGVAGLAAIGLVGMSSPIVASSADEVAKRDDDTTGPSANTNDSTASNVTGVSRDRDISAADNTRDWTMDGGDGTRDWSENRTNDRSRNDTRA